MSLFSTSCDSLHLFSQRGLPLALAVMLGLPSFGLFSSLAVCAEPVVQTVSHKESVPTLKPSPAVFRFVQNITGVNLLGRVIATKVAEKQLRKEIAGDLDIDLSTYSTYDLLKRRLKQVAFTGENLEVANAPRLASLSIISDKRLPLFLQRKKIKLMGPVTFNIQAEVSEDDLNAYLASESAQKKFSQLRVPLPPFSEPETITLSDMHVALKDSRIYLDSWANLMDAPEENAVAVSGEVTPIIENKELRLNEVHITIPEVSDTSGIEDFLEHSLHDVIDPNHLIHIKHHHSRVYYKTARVEDGRLYLEADWVLQPRR